MSYFRRHPHPIRDFLKYISRPARRQLIRSALVSLPDLVCKFYHELYPHRLGDFVERFDGRVGVV